MKSEMLSSLDNLRKESPIRFSRIKNLIGICGNARHGKDTLGKLLAQSMGGLMIPGYTQQLAFADAVKNGVAITFGIPIDTPKDQITWLGITYRQVLQQFGTEAMRRTFGEDIWIRIVDNIATNLAEEIVGNLIVTDVRFENEADWIINNYGTIIHIRNPRVEVDLSHESERFPARFASYTKCRTHREQIRTVTNSTSLEDLQKHAKAVLSTILTRQQVLEKMEEKRGTRESSPR